MVKKPTFAEQVAETIIAHLEAGTAPWQKPWEAGSVDMLPHNPKTGNRYNGINALNLMLASAGNGGDNRWLTYKQAQDMGAQVRKGEKGTTVQYWQFTEEKNRKDTDGKNIIGDDGKPEKEIIRLERPRVFYATVFNATQVDGLPPMEVKEKRDVNWINERAEKIIKASGAVIHHDQHDRAFYRPSTDQIHMPDKSQFAGEEAYYSTALHELGHWTGHESRLDRDLNNPHGSIQYAKEELRAEISSFMMAMEIGTEHNPEQHAAYVGSWVKVLKDDPNEIFRAASDAEKITKYICDLELKQEQVQEQVQVQAQAQGKDRFVGYTVERETNEVRETDKLVNANDWWEDTAQSIMIKQENGESANMERGEIPNKDSKILVDENNFRIIENKAVKEKLSDNKEVISSSSIQEEKVFLSVPFSEKDQAKDLGAKWDRSNKSWFIPSDISDENKGKLLEKWEVNKIEEKVNDNKEVIGSSSNQEEKVFLSVPFSEKDQAKDLGAKWDRTNKSWFMPSSIDDDKKKVLLEKWGLDNNKSEQMPAMSIDEEFRGILIENGYKVDGSHPILDGKWHRVPTVQDSKGSLSGSYKAFSDGVPSMLVRDFRTDEVKTYTSKGYFLTDKEKSNIQAVAAERKQENKKELESAYKEVSLKVTKAVLSMADADSDNSYVVKKGVNAHKGLKTDKYKNAVIAAQNVSGDITTMQTIYPDGNKRFEKLGEKSGSFHVLGAEVGQGIGRLNKENLIVLAEGYATAATVAETLKQPVVSCFDASNLILVAEKLKDEFPDKAFLIVGDDDSHLILQGLNNHGKEAMKKAEEITEGVSVSPVFMKSEKTWDSNIDKFTAEEFKEKKISEEQRAEYDRVKKYSDFNDLAKVSKVGQDGVTRQLTAAKEKALEKNRSRNNKNVQENKRERSAKVSFSR